MTINQEMSMLEVAELLIQRKIKPQKFEKIAKEVCEMMGLTDDEFQSKLAQFYTDLTLSGKFVTVGEDKWDLKSRQKYEVANYDTYDIDFDDEEVEFYILEQTQVNGISYLLVTDSEDDDAECLIMKDLSKPEDKESLYEIVEDEVELQALLKVFEELLEDVDIEM